MSDTWAADLARKTRLAQGLPATVEDPTALDHLATLLTTAAPRPAAAGVDRGTGAAGPTRRGDVRGSASSPAARAGQPSGSSAPARSKSTKKAGVAVTTPAPNTSTPVEGVRRQA